MLTWAYRDEVLDLEPQGPLPPKIYWRRRGLALGIVAAVLAVVVAIVFAIMHGGSDSSDNPDAAGTEQPEAVPPEGKTPVVPPASESAPPQPTPTEAVTPPPVLKDGDDCPDSALAVKGLTSQPGYTVGEQPKFTMVVTNIGLATCKRDVGAAVLAAYVYSLDNQRLWSNLDCAPSNETLVKDFTPGEQVVTNVTWTGTGSKPQCPLPREPIGPGTYNLVVQLGNLRSAAVPFVLAEPGAENPPAQPEQPQQPGEQQPGEQPTGPPPGPVPEVPHMPGG
ncbi:hypothetical protein MKOR_35170 [Mycolicibacillus koreensis]|nr:hypothetical protein MKOR_35170 [Mycolicibacillus koreensis]